MGSRQDVRAHSVAAAGAGALALSLWMPWYGFRIPGAAISSAEQFAHQLGTLGPLITQGAEIARHLGPLHVTAWQVYTALPAVLLVCAVVGGGLALLALTGRASGVSQLIALAGVVGVGLIVFRLFAPPLNGLLLHPTWGLYLGLAGSLLMLAGGALASREESRELSGLLQSPTQEARWSTAHSVPPPAAG